LLSTFLLVVVVPFGPDAWLTNFSAGVFYALAIGSVSVIGILVAGWSSANKYSLLGGLRAAAQQRCRRHGSQPPGRTPKKLAAGLQIDPLFDRVRIHLSSFRYERSIARLTTVRGTLCLSGPTGRPYVSPGQRPGYRRQF